MNKFLTAVCAASISFTSFAYAGDIPKLPKHSDYSKARQTLMALGYQPVHMEDADQCDASIDFTRCFPERESCSDSGNAPCIFTWRRGDAVIQVNTIGDPPFIATITCDANCKK